MTDSTSAQSVSRFPGRRTAPLVNPPGGVVLRAARKHVGRPLGIASGIVIRPELVVIVGITSTSYFCSSAPSFRDVSLSKVRILSSFFFFNHSSVAYVQGANAQCPGWLVEII